MTSFYCQHCNKSFNNKFKQKHLKSKKHLYMYNDIVINKHNIGNIPFSDLENIIHQYITEYNTKFDSFSILVKCNLYGEDINISINNRNDSIPLCKFKEIGSVFYEYSQSKKVRDYVYQYALWEDIKLDSNTIINNLTITIFSEYYSMKSKHQLQQPRPIFESKILKHTNNLSYTELVRKYPFLVRKYKIL